MPCSSDPANLLQRLLAVAEKTMYPPAKVSTPAATLRALADEVTVELGHMREHPRVINDECEMLVGALNALQCARETADGALVDKWGNVCLQLASIARLNGERLGVTGDAA